MANFYNTNGDLINIAYEYPCVYEDIYILGLEEGEVLVSYSPSFMQNSNGLIIGIDSRFTHFYIVQSNESIIKSLRLNWINDCTEDIQLQVNKINHFPLIISGVGFVCVIICLLAIRRKK